MGEWWDGDAGGAGGWAEAFGGDDDVWMRFEHRGDASVIYKKEAEDDPWTDVTGHMKGSFPHMDFRFEPGSYLIGLFVTSGLEPAADVEVAFDYFRSPEIKTLGVEPAGKAAVTWAALKDTAR